MDVPGASEDLKRGVGLLSSVYAMDFNEISVDTAGMPDLTGGPMDWFAIATANNLINMTAQHDRRDDLPINPQEIIDELKQDMQFNLGIITKNFLTGKAAFVDRYALPITTEEILRPSIDDLAYAFSTGDVVEISTTMIRSQSGKENTGHVLTGVSAYQDGDDAGLAVRDPATPFGNDISRLTLSGGDKPFILMEYTLWDGITFIDAIYIQRWEESDEASEESGLALPEEDGSAVSIPDGTTETDEIEGNTDENTKEEESSSTNDTSSLMTMKPEMELAFDHVKSGEYSEIYAAVTGLTPGDEIHGYMAGTGTELHE